MGVEEILYNDNTHTVFVAQNAGINKSTLTSQVVGVANTHPD